MMKIFICYRHDDVKSAAWRLLEQLSVEFGQGNVFLDEHSTPMGATFFRHAHEELHKADAVLVLIGPHWRPERLHNPGDFVRKELEDAMDHKLRILPVQVDGAALPAREDVPEHLRNLLFKVAVPLTAGPDYDYHLQRIVQWIHDDRLSASGYISRPPSQTPDPVPQRPASAPPARQRTRPMSLLAYGAVLGVLALGALWMVGRPSEALPGVAAATARTEPLSMISTTLRPVADNPALLSVVQDWAGMRQLRGNAKPAALLYAPVVNFWGSTHRGDTSVAERDFRKIIEQGGSFALDVGKSVWISEEPQALASNHACNQLPSATGPITKARLWVTEVRKDRVPAVGCERLEGVYALRLRELPDGLRICHETWTIDDGICSSCPTSRLCARDK